MYIMYIIYYCPKAPTVIHKGPDFIAPVRHASGLICIYHTEKTAHYIVSTLELVAHFSLWTVWQKLGI